MTPPPTTKRKNRNQALIRMLLYYRRAVNSEILPSLGFRSFIRSNPIEHTITIIKQLLEYLHTYSDATIQYYVSGIILRLFSDASYLSKSQARSRAGSYFFLINTQEFPRPLSLKTHNLPMNVAVNFLSMILKSVLVSASETELAALFHSTCKATTLYINTS